MTTQEAADELQYAINLIKQDGKDWLDERDIAVLDMAISALEKQIPKEPAVMIDTWICPRCNNGIEYQFLLGDNVLFHGFHDFCPKCGQKICWEEEG